METIGLIAAMPQESEALLRCIGEWKRSAFGQFRGARFELGKRECILITSGMGLERAAAGTRALLAATSAHVLVSFGIAGAVNADLRIGDVVIAGKCWLLQSGRLSQMRPLATLSAGARLGAIKALQPAGARLLAGTAITTRGSQVVLSTETEITQPVLEMETAGIAQVAAEAGIALLSMRSISDGPQSPIPFDLEAIMDEDYKLRPGQLLAAILRNPRILLQSRQMMRNSGKAAENAALAVIGALSQPEDIITA